jgi:hypothetical protein
MQATAANRTYRQKGSVYDQTTSDQTSAVQMRPSDTLQTGSRSGPQDDPPAVVVALPGGLDLGERHLVDVDRQLTGGRDGHELRYRADDLSQGDGPGAAAEDLQPGAAQHVSGQRDGGVSHLPDFHQADPRRGMGQAAPGNRRDGRLGGVSP